jgi:cytochrome c-type biogenesis protein CcmH/NrfF
MKFMLPLIFIIPLLATETNENLVKDIKISLMAPCCWSGTVYDHGHDQMEQEIDEFVKNGKSKEFILNHYSSIYGERILSTPSTKGINLAVWVTPPLLALAAFGFYVHFMKNPSPISQSSSDANSDIPFDKEIEKELKEFQT